ncbi:MAG TPA: hypothetical protein VHX62_17000, partial [Solirubrobacteraceae bacterium]|nr:hypothetical protein [Solirubrobacteraceae bacterium]
MSDLWPYIRMLRATPPPLVTEDRIGVFASALEHSEQLMRAAEAVGPAARPLPLFYALSQAGRAIAAARIEDDQWRLSGHGLNVWTPPSETSVLKRVVKPEKPGKRAIEEGRRNSFAGVAEAIGSGALTDAAELGAIWCAIPGLIPPTTPQMPELDPQWRRPLVVFDFYWNAPDLGMQLGGTELIVCGLAPGVSAQQLEDELSHYPGATGARVRTDQYMAPLATARAVMTATTPEGRNCPRVTWPGPRETHPRIDDVAPVQRDI